MKKELRLRDDERLSDWCERLARFYGCRVISSAELQEVLKEVSVKSYTHGSNDAIGAIKNRRV